MRLYYAGEAPMLWDDLQASTKPVHAHLTRSCSRWTRRLEFHWSV